MQRYDIPAVYFFLRYQLVQLSFHRCESVLKANCVGYTCMQLSMNNSVCLAV